MAKILIVDDEEDILFLLEQTFTKAGHVVQSTSDPKRALPLVRNGRFDALVLDVMMPKVSGWDLLDQIRQQKETQSIPVLLLTALSAVSDRVRGLRAGADDYLTKPFEPDELMARVEGLIQRRAASIAALQGQLEVHPVHEVLQQLDQGRKTGHLEIASDTDVGSIRLREGRIIGANHRELEGEEAVLSLLALEAGSFRLDPEAVEETEGSTLSLPVPPLLMQSAWIEDELAKRTHLLPSSSVPLHLEKSLPAASEDLPTLPLGALSALLGRPQGATMEELLQGCPAVAKRIRLAVAWLMEQEVLRSEPVQQVSHPVPTPLQEEAAPGEHVVDEERMEDLDVAVREFLQSALFRGLRLEEIRMEIYLDPEVWGTGMGLLRTLPPTLMQVPRSTVQDAFSRPLKHPAGKIEMEFKPLRKGPSGELRIDPMLHCAGVVLWLDAGWSMEDLGALNAQLAVRAPAAGCLLLSSNAFFRNRALEFLSADARWRVPVKPPKVFDELFLELAQADPHGEQEP